MIKAIASGRDVVRMEAVSKAFGPKVIYSGLNLKVGRGEVLGPVEKLAAEFWPGVPVLPILQPGATDGQFLNAAGIPTYGFEPVFVGPDLGNIHGLNEYVGVKPLLEGREFLYRLVKIYADEK